jgi:hypothetical protein
MSLAHAPAAAIFYPGGRITTRYTSERTNACKVVYNKWRMACSQRRHVILVASRLVWTRGNYTFWLAMQFLTLAEASATRTTSRRSTISMGRRNYFLARDTVHKLQNLQQHPEEAQLTWVGGRSSNGIIWSSLDEEAATLLGGGSVDELSTPVKLNGSSHALLDSATAVRQWSSRFPSGCVHMRSLL